MSDLDETNVIVVARDRYGGAYTPHGDGWVAFANRDETKVSEILARGPWGDDGEAMTFWTSQPELVATGTSPGEALERLMEKLERYSPHAG